MQNKTGTLWDKHNQSPKAPAAARNASSETRYCTSNRWNPPFRAKSTSMESSFSLKAVAVTLAPSLMCDNQFRYSVEKLLPYVRVIRR